MQLPERKGLIEPMSLHIKEENLNALDGFLHNSERGLHWPHPFSLPLWMKTWWESFDTKFEMLLLSVWENDQLLGLAPLIVKDDRGLMLGSADVCDYLDFITVPGREDHFFQALLPELKKRGLRQLELEAQRPDAAVFSGLFASRETMKKLKAKYFWEDESFTLQLAGDWEGYLAALKKKQRHEVRRKLRRLENESGSFSYRVLEEKKELEEHLPHFFGLFQQNPEKKGFLTAQMESYFHNLIAAAAGEGLARFGLLEIDGKVAASILYFEYRDRVYLYNSGYDHAYSNLSAGLLSKVLCIKDSIERGRSTFDFLKGTEIYKSRLGGTSIPIYRVLVDISEL